MRVNTISAGPLGSRAAKAIGFIDDMIRYSYANAPIQKELAAKVGAQCRLAYMHILAYTRMHPPDMHEVCIHLEAVKSIQLLQHS